MSQQDNGSSQSNSNFLLTPDGYSFWQDENSSSDDKKEAEEKTQLDVGSFNFDSSFNSSQFSFEFESSNSSLSAEVETIRQQLGVDAQPELGTQVGPKSESQAKLESETETEVGVGAEIGRNLQAVVSEATQPDVASVLVSDLVKQERREVIAQEIQPDVARVLVNDVVSQERREAIAQTVQPDVRNAEVAPAKSLTVSNEKPRLDADGYDFSRLEQEKRNPPTAEAKTSSTQPSAKNEMPTADAAQDVFNPNEQPSNLLQFHPSHAASKGTLLLLARPSGAKNNDNQSGTSESVQSRIDSINQQLKVPKYQNRPRENQPAKDAGQKSASIPLSQYWLKSLEQNFPGDPTERVSDNWGLSHNTSWDLEASLTEQKPLTNTETQFWKRDGVGEVTWFLDQNGVGWSRVDTDGLFRSSDGGECVVSIVVDESRLQIEDCDGSILIISIDGIYSARKENRSREEKMRTLMDVFALVDVNHDERLSLAEIEEALEKCEPKDKDLVRSLRTHFKRIEWAKRGTYGQASQGLSLQEILDFTATEKHCVNDINETLLAQVESIVEFADPVRSGLVNLDQLSHSMRRLNLPTRLRTALEMLLDRLEELALMRAYGYNIGWQPSRQCVRLMLCDLYKQVRSLDESSDKSWAHYELDAHQPDLFGDKGNIRASIVPAALKNCPALNQSFLAVVAAVIAHDPQLVLKMIRKSDNGAFVLTFPSDPHLPVRIISPTHKEIQEYGSNDRFGIWTLLLAKAFNQYVEQKRARQQLIPKDERVLIDSIEQICMLFCSQPISSRELNGSPDEIEKLLKNNWLSNKPMLVCRFPSITKDCPDAALNHTFAITSFDSDSGMISLFNPHLASELVLNAESMMQQFQILVYSN
ncbi:MAG: hypothetical protein K2X93_21585 [Candidatus Obscuribacterales bacterium]|nr:hypothetical protein [Candidatus Obscuribacterales bacterium]